MLLWYTLHAIQAQKVVSTVPEDIKSQYDITSDWYAKYIDAWGLPVLGSQDLEDSTLEKAHQQLGAVLFTNPWPVPKLNELKVRIVIIARNEKMSSIPEVYARFGTDLDARMWGGFGGTPDFPFSTATEANIADNSGNENVFVHEFAHTLHLCSLRYIDQNFMPDLEMAYENAKQNGLWTNTYAIKNIEEYFAESTQSYFDCNKLGVEGGDGIHNDINTRDKLASYDSQIYNLLERIYSGKRLPKIEAKLIKQVKK